MRYIIFIVMLNIISLNFCLSEEQKIIRFADSLKKEGELYRAITEYKRANSYFPESMEKADNYLKIAECYEAGEHYYEALLNYRIVLNLSPDCWEAKYKVPFMHFKMYEYNLSEEFINKCSTENTAQNDSLVILSSLNSIYQMRFDEAKAKLEKIEHNAKAQSYAKILNEKTPLKMKNRNTAAITATIIPGGGYFYVGKVQTGIAALIVNSAMIYGAISSFDNDHNEAGYAFSILAFSFHSGSIFGAMQSAGKYNKTQYNNLMQCIH